ncbi:MAG: type II secretion system F family protein [Planctomycetota bacterium]
MKLVYEAYDASGQAVRGSVEAGDEAAARDQLARQGLIVLSVGAGAGADARPARSAAAGERSDRGGGDGRRVSMSKKLDHLVEFSRQLGMLATTGTPLADALGALERQTADEAWAEVLRGLSREVEQGAPLSEAMAMRSDVFDAVSRSLVAAGEASGELPSMLRRISAVTRQTQTTYNAVRGALMYPFILLMVAIIVIGVMLVVVVPRFADMFQSLNAPLPPTTVALVQISDIVRGGWWALGPIIIGLVVGAAWWLRTPAGLLARDRALVHAPIAGSIVRSLASARLARLLGALLKAKLPLLEALVLVRSSMNNRLFSDLVGEAHDEVSQGGSLAGAFERSQLVSATLAEGVRSGESTGRLDEVLGELAEHLDEDNNQTIRTLTTLIEPVILIIMGLLVGFVAVSMFLPLFDLTAATGGG